MLSKSALYFFGCFLILISCQVKKDKTQTQSVSDVVDSKVVAPDLPLKASQNENVSLDFIMGKFNPSNDTSFVEISSQYADREGMFMKQEAFDAFKEMYNAALKDGIKLQIRSAARNFDYQKQIWEKKWTGKTILSNGENASTAYSNLASRAKKILEYSSMPGTSRHHWGTDIDFNSFDNAWFESGEGLKLFNWLESNASSFGFCRPYTAKNDLRPNGYNEEKWHWSYTPLSDIYTEFAKNNLDAKMITNFAGSGVTDEIDVVNNYVLGINQSCNNH